MRMVPGRGPKSNSDSTLFTQWKANSKDLPTGLESVLTTETCEEFFDTLAEWNSYLERHVPYFSEQEAPDEFQPE